MTTSPENLVIQKAEVIVESSAELYGSVLHGQMLPIDYLSIYSNSQEENQRLRDAAQHIGSQVFDKNGPVYELSPEAAETLPTKIVRIRNPKNENALLGCVDFVVGRGQYQTVKRMVGPVRDEEFKELRLIPATEHEPASDYQIFRVVSQDPAVEIFFPSVPLTRELMKLRR